MVRSLLFAALLAPATAVVAAPLAEQIDPTFGSFDLAPSQPIRRLHGQKPVKPGLFDSFPSELSSAISRAATSAEDHVAVNRVNGKQDVSI